MAARARGPLSAALAATLVVLWTACGHDTLRLLPASEDASVDADEDDVLNADASPTDASTDRNTDAVVDVGVDSDDFDAHTDGFGGSGNDHPFDFDAGTMDNQGGAPNCDDGSCGPCAPDDIDCLRCLFVVSCEFRPDDCLDEWRTLGCAQCSQQVPCTFQGQSCHLPSNRCSSTCQSDGDCLINPLRKCEPEDGVCVECTGDLDCCPPGSDCGWHCHKGLCFECAEDEHCRGGEICVQGRCHECLSDFMCDRANEPLCLGGNCVECRGHGDCDNGEFCHDQLSYCVRP